MPPPTRTKAEATSPRSLVNVIGVLTSFISISLVVFVYRRALVPLYGSGPTSILLNEIGLLVIANAAILPKMWSISGPDSGWLLPALLLSLAPKATYWVAVITSRRGNPVQGPIITHFVVLLPLLSSLTAGVMNEGVQMAQSSGNETHSRTSLVYTAIAAGLCSIAVTKLPDALWTRMPFLNNISDSQIYLALAGVMWILFTFNPPLPSSERRRVTQTSIMFRLILALALATLWWSFQPFLSPPVLRHPLAKAYTHPTKPLRILSSVQSTTGLIVVGEVLPSSDKDARIPPVRYMRASHSLLGGVWMGEPIEMIDEHKPVKDSFGVPLGDSVYGAFVLQEAARLVNSTKRGQAGLYDNALMIGLGIGTSATAFMRHGVSTTIVEIDPAVYNAAKTFFGLPDPGLENLFLQDARQWVEEQRQGGPGKKLYDIVVHDCFSGGGVPEHIFTFEFWEDLKASMHDESVLVVNFVGMADSDATRMVLLTLEKSFGQCRAFHDLLEDLTEDKYDSQFINIAFFCTTSSSPLTFRTSEQADYLGSPLRRHVLKGLPGREIKLDLIRDSSNDAENNKYLLTDAHNPLGKIQKAQSGYHWKMMRTVLPNVHWETY